MAASQGYITDEAGLELEVPLADRPGRRAAIEEGRPRDQLLAREGLHRRALIMADALAVITALALTLWVGIGYVPALDIATLPLIVLAIVVVNKAAGLYDRDELVLNKTTLEEAPALLQISALLALLVWLARHQVLHAEPSSGAVLLLWTSTLALLLLGRVAARSLARRVASVERCLVIGDPAGITALEAKLSASRAKAEVVARIDVAQELSTLDLPAFRMLVVRHRVDRVIIAPLWGDQHAPLDLIRMAKAIGLRVSLVPRLLEVVGSAVTFDELDGLTVLAVRRAGLGRSSRMLKRGFDLVGATAALVLLGPAMLAIAIAIRLDSHGRALFRQVRVGRDGRRFWIFKFRSMVADAEALKASVAHLNGVEGMFKIPEDPRLTRVGRLLRRWRLDELPQLFNVWRGDMSLVGPRPLVVDEDAMITGLDRSRLRLTPGMTGPWQVLGSTRIPMQEMVAIDYLYVANWSLWADVKLLLRTVPIVFSRNGL
jgi:exopolysaccharide biosynthesis polyprenyl glycosylphosphotransferase